VYTNDTSALSRTARASGITSAMSPLAHLSSGAGGFSLHLGPLLVVSGEVAAVTRDLVSLRSQPAHGVHARLTATALFAWGTATARATAILGGREPERLALLVLVLLRGEDMRGERREGAHHAVARL